MKSKVIIRKPTTFELKVSDCETPVGVSLTVPDQTMQIREIYSRFASGRQIDSSVREPLYHGDDVLLPNPKAMDLVEIAEMLEATRENAELLKHQLQMEREVLNNLEREKQDKERKEEDERLMKLYKERSDARTNPS